MTSPGRTRRSLLQAAAGLACLRGAAAGAEPGLPSLKDAAARAGLLFGSDSDTDIAAAPAAYQALMARHCSLFAPLLSWHNVSKGRIGNDQTQEPAWEDPNIGFARRNGMRLTGGHLLWHENSPDWFARVDAGAPAQAAAERHITQMAQHYAGQVFSWNVVNEAIDAADGGPDGMRRSVYTEKLGPGYIAAAFRTARAADPGTLLVYNDAGFEMRTHYCAARRAALLRLLDRLQRDAPIDGVGLQSHLRIDNTRFDPALYQRFLQEIASRGLRILITELDVLDLRGSADIAVRDADVAARYADFLATALAEPAVKSLVTWGLSDRYTWLTADRGAGFGRPDRLPTRPLPFDAAFQPKPAYDAILRALQAAPQRAPAP